MNLPSELRKLAVDYKLIWEVARYAIEEELIDLRDSGLSVLNRGNGLVIKEEDGEPSSIIRFGPEVAVRIALNAIADHLEKQENSDG